MLLNLRQGNGETERKFGRVVHLCVRSLLSLFTLPPRLMCQSSKNKNRKSLWPFPPSNNIKHTESSSSPTLFPGPPFSSWGACLSFPSFCGFLLYLVQVFIVSYLCSPHLPFYTCTYIYMCDIVPFALFSEDIGPFLKTKEQPEMEALPLAGFLSLPSPSLHLLFNAHNASTLLCPEAPRLLLSLHHSYFFKILSPLARAAPTSCWIHLHARRHWD